PAASLKRTKTRFTAGLKAIEPLPFTKMPKVGVSPALICVVTVDVGGAIQAPVPGFVWQIDNRIGRVTLPVSAEATIGLPEPTFTVATARTPVPKVIAVVGMLMIPSLFIVAARATMSGVGVVDAES